MFILIFCTGMITGIVVIDIAEYVSFDSHIIEINGDKNEDN